MNAILRRTSLLGILAVIAGVLTALRVNPVSGETYRLPGSAGPYLFGVNKVQPDGSKVTRYENWANERRLDGPTWTLYPGSAGLNVLAQQQGAWTMELWVRAYIGNATSQHWSDASGIRVQVVPLFVIGNPPGSGPIDPLNMTYGDYLTWLEKYYGGLSDAVTAIKCGTPSPNPTTVVLNCLSFMWSHLPDPLPKVLDAASSVIGCASVANLNLTAVGSCAGGMKLIIFVIHQALLHEPTGVGQTFLNQRMPLPGG